MSPIFIKFQRPSGVGYMVSLGELGDLEIICTHFQVQLELGIADHDWQFKRSAIAEMTWDGSHT